jgi:hypothetical protein
VITFKSPEDLAKLPPTDPAYPTVKDLVERLIEDYTWDGHPYNPDWYGYTVLIQEGDTERTLDEIWNGFSLLTIPWEDIMLRDGFFIAIYLANNEYGLCFVIPDAPWVNGDRRKAAASFIDLMVVLSKKITD